MSRKLSGAQYHYNARNVEALAAQMVLTTWRTVLLGVPFQIYSDHNSLKYLFTQKALSQRLLRLCEFFADYNFTEIKYAWSGECSPRLPVTPMGIHIAVISYQYAGDVLHVKYSSLHGLQLCPTP